MKEAAYVHWL